jgi:hypothetical protein
MKTIKLPRKHVQDFMERFDEKDYPTVIRWMERQVEVELTEDWPMQNLFEDALYYSDGSGMDADYMPLVRSARRVVEILNPIVPKKWGRSLRDCHPTTRAERQGSPGYMSLYQITN